MARNDQSFAAEVKRIVRQHYDDSDEPKASVDRVAAAIKNADLSRGYRALRDRGEVYEYGEYVRVTDDVLQ